MMNDIKKIHHIAMNPLDCNIDHEEGDTLTVQRVKALAYLVRSGGCAEDEKCMAALASSPQPTMPQPETNCPKIDGSKLSGHDQVTRDEFDQEAM